VNLSAAAQRPRIPPTLIALSGGIGGAKLVDGFAQARDPASLLVIANTGDDFEHLGLRVSPDLDTLIYTLAGLADPERGWGRAGDTWAFMEALAQLGGPIWFRLGDRDLALNVWRTGRLRSGAMLAAVTDELCARLGIRSQVTPMTDAPLATILDTDEGILGFQEYFVRRQCRPRVQRIRFESAGAAPPAAAVAAAMRRGDAQAIVICPSNPYLSIDPILAVAGVRAWLENTATPVVAVSPIVGGEAIKGPTAKLMRELSGECSALQVARHYDRIADLFVLDERDVKLRPQIEALGMEVLVTDIVMRSSDDRMRLARTIDGALAAKRRTRVTKDRA
jgi:LPPG:FO 2-phospho-L-lactate transferase